MSWRLRVINRELQYLRQLPRELWLDITPGPRLLNQRPMACVAFGVLWCFLVACSTLVHCLRIIGVSVGVLFSRRPGDWL